MSCPHGWGPPGGCSMCLGAVPRRVERDQETGALLLDGEPVARAFQGPATGHGKRRKRNRPVV